MIPVILGVGDSKGTVMLFGHNGRDGAMVSDALHRQLRIEIIARFNRQFICR